jgi:hypothetical protein
MFVMVFLILNCFYTLDDSPNSDVNKIQHIRTIANVTVSDGSMYKAETFYISPQRAIFKQIYPNKESTTAIDGCRVWQFDGQSENEGNPFYFNFVLGHQFHAMLLGKLGELAPITDTSKIKFVLETLKRDLPNNITIRSFKTHELTVYIVYDSSEKPIGMLHLVDPNFTITYTFDMWKTVNGITLPWQITIDDQSRIFNYKYSEIDFNEGMMNDYRAPLNKQTNIQQIHRLHRQLMDDHLFERSTTMVETQGDSMYVLSGGEMYRNSGEANSQRFKQMMGNRDYHIYDDLIVPVVQVSDDATLAWAMVQIFGKGVYLNTDRSVKAPLEFTFAWVELYRKVNGRWTMFGNVSNSKN